ncbi:LppC putative lipoprotein [Aquitalea magnusonii]|uniref:LppC putative lipoprotein n=2 Tax=Aquitalea magnusonii TaxID=332411 RepID=A0A3G9GIQ3_9NEIS|nr:LppC putative lipoprotein [Aquitalea magnusonii]
MQRLAPLLVGVMMTWLTAAHAQAPDYIIQLNAAPLNSVAGQSPRAQAQPASAPVAPVAKPLAAPGKTPVRVKIGVLLPTESKLLGEAAAVVRSGVDAAHDADPQAELVVIDADEHNAAQRYREAVAGGVNVVIGPLSRGGIAAVAPYVSVPTLALNAVGRDVPTNPKLFTLALNVEVEARQIARLMRDDGRSSPLIIADGEVLSSRLKQAFADEWRSLGGRDVAQLEDNGDNLSGLAQALSKADAVFLAVEPAEAARLKPALPAELPVYATSQISTRSPDRQLAGVRFIDMPWFLMPQHPAVKRYARPASTLTLQTERLYALGIDAYRLALLLGSTRNPASIKLDGVTGDLKLGRDRVFDRQLPVSLIGEGE